MCLRRAVVILGILGMVVATTNISREGPEEIVCVKKFANRRCVYYLPMDNNVLRKYSPLTGMALLMKYCATERRLNGKIVKGTPFTPLSENEFTEVSAQYPGRRDNLAGILLAERSANGVYVHRPSEWIKQEFDLLFGRGYEQKPSGNCLTKILVEGSVSVFSDPVCPTWLAGEQRDEFLKYVPCEAAEASGESKVKVQTAQDRSTGRLVEPTFVNIVTKPLVCFAAKLTQTLPSNVTALYGTIFCDEEASVTGSEFSVNIKNSSCQSPLMHAGWLPDSSSIIKLTFESKGSTCASPRFDSVSVLSREELQFCFRCETRDQVPVWCYATIGVLAFLLACAVIGGLIYLLVCKRSTKKDDADEQNNTNETQNSRTKKVKKSKKPTTTNEEAADGKSPADDVKSVDKKKPDDAANTPAQGSVAVGASAASVAATGPPAPGAATGTGTASKPATDVSKPENAAAASAASKVDTATVPEAPGGAAVYASGAETPLCTPVGGPPSDEEHEQMTELITRHEKVTPPGQPDSQFATAPGAPPVNQK